MTKKILSTTAEQIKNRDRKYVCHPWSPISADRSKLTFTHGDNYKIWDVDGNVYIDAASLNLTCGYKNKTVIEAINDQLLKIHSTDLSLATHEPVGLLAEYLAKNLSSELAKTLFVNSGSEGIEAALFIAASYWSQLGIKRSRIISFANGYHGSTFYNRSISKLPRVKHSVEHNFSITYVTLPLSPRELKQQDSLKILLKSFDQALTDNKDDLPMAVIVEPFLNVGDAIVLPKGFLKGLRKLCDNNGALLILDEVFTGYGRSGKMFACQHENIFPDIMVSSKGLASGYMPIAAVTIKNEIYNTFNSDPMIGGIRYGHTTSGHAVACAAAIATLQVIESQNLLKKATDYGKILFERFSIYDNTGKIEDIRSFGLILVIDMISENIASEFKELAERFGLLIRQAGKAMMIVPPLTIDNEGIDEISKILKITLDKGRFLL